MLCLVQAESVEETSNHGVLGRHQTCSNHDGIWRNHIRESICVTSTSFEDFFKDKWMKELGSEVAGLPTKDQKSKCKNGRHVKSEQPSGSLTQEIDKSVLRGCESTNARTGFSSFVPVSVQRLDHDKDADENVNADHVRTGRHVESEQSIGLFTQREEMGIDFRVSGLPHAVVKQKTSVFANSRRRFESHPHRRAFQADLQQNNAYNPFSEETKVMAIGCFLNPELSHQEGVTSWCLARQN